MLVVDPPLLSELLPPQSRGRYMVLLDFFWPLGFLLAIGFWWAFIIQGVTLAGLEGWRTLFLLAALPAFLAAAGPSLRPLGPEADPRPVPRRRGGERLPVRDGERLVHPPREPRPRELLQPRRVGRRVPVHERAVPDPVPGHGLRDGGGGREDVLDPRPRPVRRAPRGHGGAPRPPDVHRDRHGPRRGGPPPPPAPAGG